MPRQTRLPTREEVLARACMTPLRFGVGVLGHRYWSKQREILEALETHRRVYVKACHSSGKSFVSADAALGWVVSDPKAVAITTAPSWTQVKRVMWKEIRTAREDALRNSGLAFPEVLENCSLTIRPDVNYIAGISTNEGVRFQGFHGKILVVIDEALGVKPYIWEAIDGIRAGGDVRVLAVANPTAAGGPFYDGFAHPRAGIKTISISAFDTPNLEGLTLEDVLEMDDDALDDNPWPELTTRRWVRERAEEWGVNSPIFQSRVRGEFPEQDTDALYPLAWLERAKAWPEDIDPSEAVDVEFCYRGDRYRVRVRKGVAINAGIDVAGPGDDETVLVLRQGPAILRAFKVDERDDVGRPCIFAWTESDPRGDVMAILMPFLPLGLERRSDAQGWEPGTVNVDAIGMGYYFCRHVADGGFRVRDVNVGVPAAEPERFFMMKSEIAWGLRMRLKSGDVCGLDGDDVAFNQLGAILHRQNARGQIAVESKDEIRARKVLGGSIKSPDRAEAIILAFADSPKMGGRVSIKGQLRL